MNSKSYDELFSQKLRELKSIDTFKDCFEYVKNQYYDHIFFEYDTTQVYDCNYFFKKANAVYSFLNEKLINIMKGAWIGLKLPNHPFYMILIFALQKNGFNVLLIDNKISPKKCKKIIEQSGIAAIITDKMIDGTEILYIHFEEILNLNELDITEESEHFADKIALCSSGTEGNIKISVYKGEDFLEAVRRVLIGFGHTFPESICRSESSKIVVSPPFFHIFGLLVLFTYFFLGITIVINENDSLLSFLKSVNREGVQIVAHVPLILDRLFRFIKGKYNKLTCETFKNTVSTNLKIFIGAGTNTTENIKKILRNYGIYYLDCYGTTETGVITMNNRICETTHSTVGIFRNGEFSNQGYGEVTIYGKGIRSGILENGIEFLPSNFLVDSGIKTGDLAEIKNDLLFLQGRANDIIINSNGENIIPNEIEEHFDILKDYCSYTVLGVKEKPVMVLFLKKEHWNFQYKKFLINEISKKNREMKICDRVTAIYFTLIPIPLTPSLKVRRAFVKEQIIKQAQKFEKIILIER